MRRSRIAATLALLATTPLSAQEGESLFFRQGDWRMSAVTFDDGEKACEADTDGLTGDTSLTIWRQPGKAPRLQFYLSYEQFPDSKGTIYLYIDENPRWTLSNASFYMNSILFDVTDTTMSASFFSELASGEQLAFDNYGGELFEFFSLNGAAETLAKFDDCLASLK